MYTTIDIGPFLDLKIGVGPIFLYNNQEAVGKSPFKLNFSCKEADIEYGLLKRLSQNFGKNRFVLARSATLMPKCDR